MPRPYDWVMLALVAAPSAEEKVALREVPEPQPRPAEALIEVRAISINRGEYNRLQAADDGWRPGWDISGVVKQAAADGSSPPAGARVVGLSDFGGWCEQLPLTAAHMAVIPDSLSFAAAASLPIAGLTALRTLRLGGLLLGRRVLVQGAAGGVGRFALQLGSMAGAQLTAVVGSAERGQGLRELGADDVVVGIENAEGRYDLILENAGGTSLAAALTKLAQYGTVVTFGNSAREPTTFNTSDFYFSSGRLVGFFLLDPAGRPYTADLAYLAGLVGAGQLDPQIGLEASWRDAGRALKELRERRLPGKAVLHLG
jgi:NADPH:quinone reductase